MRSIIGFALALASAHRALDEGVHCEYGYEDGKDAYGEDCEACLGPNQWANCSAWTDCAGDYQSPIDIVPSEALTSAGERLEHDYVALDGLEILNTGHNLEVEGHFGNATLGDTAFAVSQFHFHLLSEHTVDGEHYDAEMHIVHSSAAGDYVVVGIFFELTEDDVDNEFLQSIAFEEAPTVESDEGTAISGNVDLSFFSDILAGDFYRYHGSLTTPPCSELVEWFVMHQTSTISPSQYAYFQSIFPNPSNYRPVQPLNGRTVLLSSAFLSEGEACVEGADLCGVDLECTDGVCTGSDGTVDDEEQECEYGYEDGKDAYGEDCEACLGPDQWANCSAWTDCAGDYQSPIDIVPSEALTSAGERLEHDYVALDGLEILNTGHNLEVEGHFGNATLGDTAFAVSQFHFHLLSEHTVDGEHYDAEMHIVHSSAAGDYVVVGIFFELTEDDVDNEFLQSIAFEEAPTVESDEGTAISGNVDLSFFSDILAGDFYRYHGSLTTPPCSELVEWFVMHQTSTISPSQYAYFQSIFPNPSNYRPVQPLNGRTVLLSSAFLSEGEACVEGADLCGVDLECTDGVCTGSDGTVDDEEQECEYGYEDGKDAYGEDCEACLGPDQWANCSAWTDCAGDYQSPIDIVPSEALTSAGERLEHDYVALDGLEILNTGHNLEVEGHFGNATLGDTAFAVSQFHFHLLSEHTVDGEHYDAEMHIVHSSAAGDYVVVGIFFELTEDDVDNEFLQSIAFEEAPTVESDEGTAISGNVDLSFFSDILAGDFYRYHGSLTTPPCSELVEWFVMHQTSTISPSQYAYFQSIFPNPSNYRPVQPLNGRTVLLSSAFLSEGEACVEALICAASISSAPTDAYGEDCEACLGPDQWANCSAWTDCAGDYQSPIDIVPSEALTSAGERLEHDYVALDGLEILNTGHNLEVEGHFGNATLGDTAFAVSQFHFHLLSEHTVDGEHYDAEMHIVHSSAAGDYVVVGIFFELTEDDVDNEFLQSIAFEEAPTVESDEGTAISGNVDLSFFSDILAGDFYRYHGSLTTPPCSELVEWFVMQQTSTISPSQYAYFQSIFPNPSNYRPVQPLNGRTVLLSSAFLSEGEACVEGADLCGVDLECTDGVCTGSDGTVDDEEQECEYGYEDGKDAYGEDCEACLGPDQWANCSAWTDCAGDYQSPIDIVPSEALTSAGERLEHDYVALDGLEILNTGHNLEVEGHFGNATLGDTAFAVSQFHFHLLSEHTVDGEHYDAEMHIVHSSAAGDYVVVGIFFELTEDDVDNEFLQSIAFEEAPTVESDEGTAISGNVDLSFFSDILAGDFYRYHGSLTTPPCSELVEWFVMQQTSTISPSQYAYFQSIFPNPSNYRPVQPLNGRTVLLSSAFLSEGEACVEGADLCGVDLECTDGVCIASVDIDTSQADSKKKKSKSFTRAILIVSVVLAFTGGILLALFLVFIWMAVSNNETVWSRSDSYKEMDSRINEEPA
ncbi:hypothetical protein CTAYLR_009121 [Chrysophaeum taylorii]|uniref:Carbonic anhydrase n=1 Tax=Chrysophaeum taylorii TaxID=2483200 RepID=A0AAD7XPV2_9STRA|nr:hypothetical protein CTAYLR_009121 [Chrysophaeum taylorii]